MKFMTRLRSSTCPGVMIAAITNTRDPVYVGFSITKDDGGELITISGEGTRGQIEEFLLKHKECLSFDFVPVDSFKWEEEN